MSLGLVAIIVAVLALPRVYRVLQQRRHGATMLPHGGVEP
jgi:hypothetical protein